MSFALDISRFVEKAKANAETVVREIGVKLLVSIVDKSPVGNPEVWASLNPVTDLESGKTSIQRKAPAGYVGGRFRGNWQVSFDLPATGEVDRVDGNGSENKRIGAAIIQTFHVGVGSIYLMNNVPYAQRLEYGWSGQAPQGVVRITVAEFDAFVRKAVQELPD